MNPTFTTAPVALVQTRDSWSWDGSTSETAAVTSGDPARKNDSRHTHMDPKAYTRERLEKQDKQVQWISNSSLLILQNNYNYKNK